VRSSGPFFAKDSWWMKMFQVSEKYQSYAETPSVGSSNPSADYSNCDSLLGLPIVDIRPARYP
jgi:hypothetical protein